MKYRYKYGVVEDWCKQNGETIQCIETLCVCALYINAIRQHVVVRIDMSSKVA